MQNQSDLNNSNIRRPNSKILIRLSRLLTDHFKNNDTYKQRTDLSKLLSSLIDEQDNSTSKRHAQHSHPNYSFRTDETNRLTALEKI